MFIIEIQDDNLLPGSEFQAALHDRNDQGGLDIRDGWEIFDAARKTNADAIHLLVHREKDIFIHTPVPGFSAPSFMTT